MLSLSTMGAKARTIESSSSGVIHFLTNQSELNGYPKSASSPKVVESKLTNHMKTNQSKVAIVTGSSRGIGAAIAKRLASDGLAVIVNYTPATPLTPKMSSRKSGPRAGGLWP